MNRLRGSERWLRAAHFILATALAFAGADAAAFTVEQPKESDGPKVLWTLDTGG
jgi:hypothetical protein